MTEDEMVGWHHRLNGHEFDQAPGDSEEQGSLACCNQCFRWSSHEEKTFKPENMNLAIMCGKKNIAGKEVCECEVSKVRKNA